MSTSHDMDRLDTLELAPGRGLGLYRLGDTLWHVLDILRARKTELPKLEISWDPNNAHKTSVTVHAGTVALLFPHSRDQRLGFIQVTQLVQSPVTITYEGSVLASRSHQLTRAGVSRALGPTYATDTWARLAYPGVSFELSPAGAREDLVATMNVSPRDDGAPPIIEPLTLCTIKPGKGVLLSLPTDLEIVLGETTAQDLLIDLGPPLRRFWKEDDRLNRIWGNEQVDATQDDTGDQTNECFWNYFQYGIDFLVEDDVVTKVIVHSNIPGTPQFQQYARCPWVVETDEGELDFTSPVGLFRSGLSASHPLANGAEGAGAETAGVGNSSYLPATLNAEQGSKGKTTVSASDAMVLDRTVEDGLDGVVGMPLSQLVGFPGLILEIDEKSGGISGVQVWKEGA